MPQQHYSSLPNMGLHQGHIQQVSYFQGRCYLSGTAIPVLSRYGPKYYLSNIKTEIPVPMDPLGTVKLEAGQSYILLPTSLLPQAASKDEAKESGGYFGTVKRRSRQNQPATVATAGGNQFGSWDSGFNTLHQRRTSFQPGSLSISSPLHTAPALNATQSLPTQPEVEQSPTAKSGKQSVASSYANSDALTKASDSDSIDELINQNQAKPKARMTMIDFLNSEPPSSVTGEVSNTPSSASTSPSKSPSRESKLFSWSIGKKSSDKRSKVSSINTHVDEESSGNSTVSPTQSQSPCTQLKGSNITTSISNASNLDKFDTKSITDAVSISSSKKRGSLANVLFEAGSGSLLQSGNGPIIINEDDDTGSVLGTSLTSSFVNSSSYLRRTSGTLRTKVTGMMKWKVASSEPNLLDSNLPEDFPAITESNSATENYGGRATEEKQVESQPNLSVETPQGQKQGPKPVVRTTNVLNKLFTVSGNIASANTLPEMELFQVFASYKGLPARAVVVHYKLRIFRYEGSANPVNSRQGSFVARSELPVSSSSSVAENPDLLFEGLLEEAISSPTSVFGDGSSVTVVGKFGSIQLDNIPLKEAQIFMATVNTCALTIMTALGYNGMHSTVAFPCDNVLITQFKEHQWLQSHLQRVVAFYTASLPISSGIAPLVEPQIAKSLTKADTDLSLNMLPSPISPPSGVSESTSQSKSQVFASLPSKDNSMSQSSAMRPAPAIPSPSPAAMQSSSVLSFKHGLQEIAANSQKSSTESQIAPKADENCTLETTLSTNSDSKGTVEQKTVNNLSVAILEPSETCLNIASTMGSKVSLDRNASESNNNISATAPEQSSDESQEFTDRKANIDCFESQSLDKVAAENRSSCDAAQAPKLLQTTTSASTEAEKSRTSVAEKQPSHISFVVPSVIGDLMMVSNGEWERGANLDRPSPFLTSNSTTVTPNTSSSLMHAWTIEEILTYVLDCNLPFDAEFAEIVVQTYSHFTDFSTMFKFLSSYGLAPWNGFGRVRVCNFLRLWIEQGWVDFASSNERLYNLHNLLRSLRSIVVQDAEQLPAAWNYMDSGSSEVCKLINWMEEILKFLLQAREAHVPTLVSQGGALGKTSKVDFLTLEPNTIASQLTFWDHLYVLSVRPRDLLLQIWGHGKNPEFAKELGNLNALVDRFNQISYWAATEVCTQPVLKNRIKVVETLIRTVKHLLRLNNYNAATALISGLNLSAVARLRQTWSSVDSKYLNYLKDYEQLLGPAGNYKQYRTVFEEKLKEITKQYAGLATQDERWQSLLSAQGLYASNLIPLHHRGLLPQYLLSATQLKSKAFLTTPANFIAYPSPEASKSGGNHTSSNGSLLGSGSPVSLQHGSAAALPFMPFIALLLKDLLFVNDGNAKHAPGTTDDRQLINVTKLKMIHQHVQAFTICQHAVRVAAFYGVSGWGTPDSIFSDQLAAELGLLPANAPLGNLSNSLSPAASPVLPTMSPLSMTTSSLSASPTNLSSEKTSDDVVREYLRCPRGLNETQLYKYSILAEKKVGDESLDLRSKWMQGSK